MRNKSPWRVKSPPVVLASGVLLFLAFNPGGNAQDIPGNDARLYADYKDVCDFIEKQVHIGISIIENKNRKEKEEFIKNFNTAKIYRLKTKNMTIEYIKTDDDRTLVNEMKANVRWLVRSGQDIAAVERQLHMNRPFLKKFDSGCDAYSIVIKSKNGEMDSMEISSNFTD